MNEQPVQIMERTLIDIVVKNPTFEDGYFEVVFKFNDGFRMSVQYKKYSDLRTMLSPTQSILNLIYDQHMIDSQNSCR